MPSIRKLAVIRAGIINGRAASRGYRYAFQHYPSVSDRDLFRRAFLREWLGISHRTIRGRTS